jgi:hypothetical protein
MLIARQALQAIPLPAGVARLCAIPQFLGLFTNLPALHFTIQANK